MRLYCWMSGAFADEMLPISGIITPIALPRNGRLFENMISPTKILDDYCDAANGCCSIESGKHAPLMRGRASKPGHQLLDTVAKTQSKAGHRIRCDIKYYIERGECLKAGAMPTSQNRAGEPKGAVARLAGTGARGQESLMRRGGVAISRQPAARCRFLDKERLCLQKWRPLCVFMTSSRRIAGEIAGAEEVKARLRFGR